MNKRNRLILLIAIYILTLCFNISASNLQGYNYRDQLNTEQKLIYDRYVQYLKPQNTSIDLTDMYDIKGNYSENELDNIMQSINKDTQISLDAFLKDYPEIYWLKFGSNGVGPYFEITRLGSYATLKISFQIVVADKYAANVIDLNNQMQSIIENFNVSGDTRYEKVKSIHDGLCELITYESSFQYAHEPVGALVYGKAVCEGYAEAFKLLCDREGIPNILVIGVGRTSSGTEAHMWNYVQMENSKWYAVDVTWDDQSRIYYDFFLVGSKTKDKSFGSKEFSYSHIPDGDFSGYFTFNYPLLSEEAYVNIVPTQTIEPTSTPTVKPTATPTVKPTNTLKPTETIKATNTVRPTGTIKPTDTIKPTATPTNTVKPNDTTVPTATDNVVINNTFEPTHTPTPFITEKAEPTITPGSGTKGSDTNIIVIIGAVGVLAIIYLVFKIKR